VAVREAWDAIYAGSSKVGWVHLWIKPVKDSKGRDLINVRVDTEMTFRRGRDTAKMRVLYGTIETPEGEVLRLDTRTQASGQDLRVHGDVVDGVMRLALETGGRRTEQQVAWSSDVRGPYGPEMSMSRRPLKPGESRSIKTFIPDLNRIVLTNLVAADYEDVPLGPEATPHRLLRVEGAVASLDGSPDAALAGLKTTYWVDEAGQILKSRMPQFGGLTTFRTTKEGATAPSGAAMFDLLGASIIKTPQPLAGSERTRRVTYRLTGPGLAESFPSDQRQRLTPEGEGTARLDVATDSPTAGVEGPATVDPIYLRPSPLVDSEDARVVRAMKQAVGNQADPWGRAVAIQDWVFRNMKRKNFSTAFAPASEVARELSGDCTEHGVLTAAMCRAAGVPARCVVGLVYAEELGGFGFHMWNEVYVNRRWVAIDATFNQSEVDATHLKLSESALEGVSPFDAMLPVLSVVDAVRIEPLEVR
jgi:hypothetical protein